MWGEKKKLAPSGLGCHCLHSQTSVHLLCINITSSETVLDHKILKLEDKFFFFNLYPINLFCCKTTVLSMFPVLYLTPFMFTKFSSALLFSPARTESQSPDFAIQFSDKRWHLLAPTSAWRVPQSMRCDLCYLSVITNGIIGHKNYAACWKRNNTHAHYRFLR